jgi:hypothetical protein
LSDRKRTDPDQVSGVCAEEGYRIIGVLKESTLDSKPSKEEEKMANPRSAAELEKYLKGVDYPASKDDLISKARSNGAPQEVIDMINSLSESHFNSPIDVTKSFGASH